MSIDPEIIAAVRKIDRAIDDCEQWERASNDDYCAPYALTLGKLLRELVDAGYGDIVTRAVERLNRLNREVVEARAKAEQTRKIEYEEASRRHEIAVRVDCPWCGAAVGANCRSGGSQRLTKGIHDHRDRYRAAIKTLDAPKEDQ